MSNKTDQELAFSELKKLLNRGILKDLNKQDCTITLLRSNNSTTLCLVQVELDKAVDQYDRRVGFSHPDVGQVKELKIKVNKLMDELNRQKVVEQFS